MIETAELRLNLGAWDRRMEGYLSVDVCGPHADVIHDLNVFPWPFETSSVKAVFAHDVFEHLFDRKAVMNELYRILEPGGLADICVPTTEGAGACCDPTHVTYWNASFFNYWKKGNFARERFRGSDYYGVKADFDIVEISGESYMETITGHRGIVQEKITKVRILLEAVK